MNIKYSMNAAKNYNLVFNNMLAYFSAEEQKKLHECANALIKRFEDAAIEQKCILVAYGGGKDSSYMLAYVRLMQLYLLKNNGKTFLLRVATNRHVGMPKAVMENIDRVYTALDLYNDQLAELLLVDNETISAFHKDKPIPNTLKSLNRKNVLIAGHRTKGEGRPTFCNACNLSMVNSFWLASQYQKSVDMIITGDSRREQRDYFLWVRRLVEKIESDASLESGFRGFIKNVDKISTHYFQEMNGEENNLDQSIKFPNGGENFCNPHFFSIYEYTNYAVDTHWDFITKFLGFEFDDLAFSFTETDCANPALMAHIRGLKAEHVYHRNYEDGILEYLKFATKLMKYKKFPEHLILKVVFRYFEDNGMEKMRNKIQKFSDEAYDLSEEQIVCMVWSPFVGKGMLLSAYLEQKQQDLLPYIDDIHDFLSAKTNTINAALADRLIRCSGLDLDTLKTLYNSVSMVLHDGKSLASRILQDDPNKAVIKTRTSINGPLVEEVISGR